MSIANDLRKAATLAQSWWEISSLDMEILKSFTGFGEYCQNAKGAHLKNFLLLAACALDGGSKEPMTGKDLLKAVGYATRLISMSDIVRIVERHHGIGVRE